MNDLLKQVANPTALHYNSSMNWDIFGHDNAVNYLKEHTKPDKLRHAYLITGPQGVGRRSLALAFVKALNCKQPIEPGIPCGICITCQQIERMEFPDLSILVPEEGHKDIRIEQIRALQRAIVLAPYQAPYRVALLLNFQKTTLGASNALLKTLEEPPPKAVLILTADAQESLLPTIVSRCEVLRLRPLPLGDAENFLMKKKGLTQVDARLFAHITSGRIGAALRLNDDPQSLKLRTRYLDDLSSLMVASKRARFTYVESQSKRGRVGRNNIFEMINIWLTFWRDVCISIAKADVPLVNLDYSDFIHTVAGKVDLAETQLVLASLEEGLKSLDSYVNARLLAENLLLLWPRIKLP